LDVVMMVVVILSWDLNPWPSLKLQERSDDGWERPGSTSDWSLSSPFFLHSFVFGSHSFRFIAHASTCAWCAQRTCTYVHAAHTWIRRKKTQKEGRKEGRKEGWARDQRDRTVAVDDGFVVGVGSSCFLVAICNCMVILDENISSAKPFLGNVRGFPEGKSFAEHLSPDHQLPE
jgi:hypothetical protein